MTFKFFAYSFRSETQVQQKFHIAEVSGTLDMFSTIAIKFYDTFLAEESWKKFFERHMAEIE